MERSFAARGLRVLLIATGLAGTTGHLGGCSSGGGSSAATQEAGGEVFRGAATYYRNDALGEDAVPVGIADSGFRLTHEALAPYLVATYNLHDPGDPDVTGNAAHGTTVASLAAHSEGEVGLRLAKITDSTAAPDDLLAYSVGLLADEGARVINHSYDGRLELPHSESSYREVKLRDSLERIVTANDGLGSVYVVAAGNDGEPLEAETPIHGLPMVFERMLIVGGSEGGGTSLNDDSNFPGADAQWQSRFLTAPWEAAAADHRGDSLYSLKAGTSVSAPQVSAHAAAIIHRWPHLDAAEVSQLLLDTASRHSPLYALDTCGSDGTVNCGLYYLGQGEADVEAALEPRGELSAPLGARVDGASVPLSAASLQLSQAYGDALGQSAALTDMAAFDALGRDYRVDLSSHVRQTADRDLARRLSRLAMTDAPRRPLTASFGPSLGLTVVPGADAEPTASRLDGGFGGLRLTAFRFDGDAPDPTGPAQESGLMPMLAFQGGSPLTRRFDTVSGIRSELALSDDMALVAKHWRGQGSETAGYGAERSDFALALDLSGELTLTAGVGRVSETRGLLGARGTGALALGERGITRLTRLRLDYAPDERIAAFAVYERGEGEADGASLLHGIDDLATDEMALGLQWRTARHRVALALRQPRRLARAEATFRVPVGRTRDGRVMRETRRVPLAPSGRQRDVELGYAFRPDARTRLAGNLLYRRDPGHDARAPDELAALLSVLRTF
ncbi:S8 family serine peptidase [Halomonas beimenensis]|uniref:Peptidase S8/S53 domain-containing protein n=1 Tax=Halomonas beimenensis TaxID=475662 RepID=A0A291P3B1_9GAMM|nr:S8 family serine peptidase [Halomonas beimenensis]ATJ81358.1 hypothetical protein BEI_0371 [Halomonas beimenensis]